MEVIVTSFRIQQQPSSILTPVCESNDMSVEPLKVRFQTHGPFKLVVSYTASVQCVKSIIHLDVVDGFGVVVADAPVSRGCQDVWEVLEE